MDIYRNDLLAELKEGLAKNSQLTFKVWFPRDTPLKVVETVIMELATHPSSPPHPSGRPPGTSGPTGTTVIGAWEST